MEGKLRGGVFVVMVMLSCFCSVLDCAMLGCAWVVYRCLRLLT